MQTIQQDPFWLRETDSLFVGGNCRRKHFQVFGVAPCQHGLVWFEAVVKQRPYELVKEETLRQSWDYGSDAIAHHN
jgi:hypothetical protein